MLTGDMTAVSSDCMFNLKPSSCRARSYRASIPSSNKPVFWPNDQIIAYIPGDNHNFYTVATGERKRKLTSAVLDQSQGKGRAKGAKDDENDEEIGAIGRILKNALQKNKEKNERLAGNKKGTSNITDVKYEETLKF